MNGFLRFVRLLNAAIWCGSSVFLLVGLPGLFSGRVISVLSRPYAGFAAEAVFGRYFILYYVCGAVALLCLGADWVYSGKESSFDFGLVSALAAVGLLGGLVLQPRLHDWHYFKYWGKTAEVQAHAAKLFAVWHGISQGVNLLVIIGLILYLWRTARPSETPRFVAFNKIRG